VRLLSDRKRLRLYLYCQHNINRLYTHAPPACRLHHRADYIVACLPLTSNNIVTTGFCLGKHAGRVLRCMHRPIGRYRRPKPIGNH